MSGQAQFDPLLPEKRAALQGAWPAHSPARKTAMVYRRPFWRDHLAQLSNVSQHRIEYDYPDRELPKHGRCDL
ncbi:hypothetical protein FCJ61_38745 [Burkholderia metallica]|nr:hypothetical protein [Burkholderia metallica]